MKDSDRNGYILIFSVLFVFFILASFAFTLSKKETAYDSVTFCPLDGNYMTTNFVIDKTDPWSTHQKERIKNVILKMKSNLELHERLKIYILGHHKLEIEHPKFDLCNPGRGEQASPIYENPRQIQARYDKFFSDPLDKLLNELLMPGVAHSSPIIAAINMLGDSIDKSNLILVSDLMENDGSLSFYKSIPRYSEWLKIINRNSPLSLYSNIKIYFIDRSIFKPKLKHRVKSFWRTHLDKISSNVSWGKL